MKAPALKSVATEAKLLLIGIPVLLWTLIPVYHLFLFSISPKESAFAGKLWPDHPTLHNFEVVFGQKHYYLSHFWLQLWNSLLIAVSVGVLTLFVATAAAFAISRLRVKGGRTIMNLALFTYFIPAAFLAVPMYKTMGNYGLLNSQWALILAMVTIATPYSIWVLKQASDKLPLDQDRPRHRLRHRRWRVHRARRPLGLRQVDAAADARRARRDLGRHDRDRRSGRQRHRIEGPRHRHGVPELRALSAHDGRRE